MIYDVSFRLLRALINFFWFMIFSTKLKKKIPIAVQNDFKMEISTHTLVHPVCTLPSFISSNNQQRRDFPDR